MFTDTPKLQPISSSKNKDKKVPSNSGNQKNDSASGGGNASSTTANAYNNKPNPYKWVAKDVKTTEIRDNRFNYGSYRGNNYQNQNNYKTREFNDYNTNNFIQFNNFNSYNRRPDWDRTTNNTNYNRWNSKPNNNIYRNNHIYSEKTYKERDSLLIEQCVNSNKESSNKPKKIDQAKNRTILTKQFYNKKNESRKDVKPDKSNRKQLQKNTNNKKLHQTDKTKHLKPIDDTSSSKEESDSLKTCTNTTNTVVSEKLIPENNKTNILLNTTDHDNRIDEIREQESLPSIDNNVKTSKLNTTVLNTDIQTEQSTEDILDANIGNTISLTNSTDTAVCDTPNKFINSRANTNEEPKTVLEDITITLFQNTSATSPQPSNTPASSENEIFHTPKISLIPISRLISSEFWEPNCSDNVTVENSPKPSNNSQKVIYKPNLIKRKRNVSTCSNSSTSSQTNSTTDRIVEKLLTMNKINIKNIINSSETKYDEALKTQARKRLREEIRRQLKSMNIEPQKDPISVDFVPDEIVDSIDIPDVVFDEIRKALGLELFPFSNSDNLKCVEELITNSSTEDDISPILPLVEMATTTTSKSPLHYSLTGLNEMETNELPQHPINPVLLLPPPTPSRIKNEKMTENISINKRSEEKIKKSDNNKKSKRLTKRKETHKSKRHRSPKKILEDVVVLISSSSSSESSSTSSSSSSSTSSSSSSSSTSSSDSDADMSEKSSTSVAKRKRRKQKLDAENVVDSFEKLILSSLSESLRKRYQTKYSTSINTKLHFISCICTSDYNSGKFSKLQIAKIQKNLKSSDCSMALEFLTKEIVNVVNKQKQLTKEDDCNNMSRGLENSLKKGSTKDAPKKANNENVVKESPKNNGATISKSQSPLSDTLKIKNINNAEKSQFAAINGEKHIQHCVSKVLSLYRQEMKAAMQANEAKNQPSSTHKSSTLAESEAKNLQQKQHQQTSAEIPTSNNLNKNAVYAKPNEDEAHLRNPINCINQQQQNQHQTTPHQSVITGGSFRRLPQCDDTPQEKTSTQIIPIHNYCSSDYTSNEPTTLNSNLNSNLLDISSSLLEEHQSFPTVDLEELKKQSPIGEVVVNSLREIDVKLMELHKRKMYLEEMILKFQKDKMEADLLTIKLQNEKFMLLNTAMTANVTSTALQNRRNNNENVTPSSGQLESFSSFKNIKMETSSNFTHKSNIITEKEAGEPGKNDPKSRSVCKSPAPLKTTSTATKRKQTPTDSASDTLKKRKSSKKTSAPKNCSKKPVKPTKAKTNKASESNLQTSPTCEASSTIANVTNEPTNCSSSLPEKSTNSTAISEAPIPSQSQPTTTEINENSPVDDNKISLYKKMPSGSFEGIRNPVTQIRIFDEFIVASSEDGKLYKFDVTTLKLLTEFAKHTEAITQMHLCPERKTIYTTSLDGYIKKTSLENLALDIQSVYLQEPLQSIDIQWDIAYIGSRWGNIYTYNVITNSLAEKPLCSTDSSIISIKAAKDGIRKILIVSSKGNLIHLRDAISGHLLRTFDVPESINIYSILLNDGVIYCGTQKKEIRKYDFMSGQCLGLMTCGNGAVSMQMYNNKYIFVGCYDGFIYILDKSTGKQVGRLAGSGKMILTLEIIEDKIITSAKDNTMKVTDIPSYCLKTALK